MGKMQKRVEYLLSVLALCGAMYLVMRVPSCGSTKPDDTSFNPTLNKCGDVELGKTRTTLCSDGKSKKIEACTENGLTVAIDCPDIIGCGDISFTDIKPIIDKKCLSCHPGFGVYANAKKSAPQMLARIQLTAADPQRMPKQPAPPLPADEIKLFQDWQKAGFLEKCENKQPPKTAASYNLNQVEDAITADLSSLNLEDRSNARYLVASHKVNQGSSPEDLEAFMSGASKGVNSISKKARKIVKLPSAGLQSIMRINLKDFQLSIADWDKITAADPLKIISLTNRGKNIQLLANNKQPWMHFDNFLDTVFRNSTLYYTLLGVPTQIDALFKQLEVNFFNDFLNFRAQLIGTNKSPITLNKNRLISRHDSLDGYFWTTFDIAKVAGQKNQNLFEAPLLVFAKGKGNAFNFNASEVIYSLPNGLQAYALFNNQGVRQDVAPLNVVTDVDSPISPEIRSANSCHRCHAGGIIPAVDEIRDHVILNASQFPAGDVDIVKALYRDAKTNVATFQKDNSVFTASIASSGIKPGVDPINFSTDRLLLNWDLNQTASFFFIPKEDFVVLLNQSAVGRTQAGQLLSGGSITYDQFVAVLPVLIKDLRLFQEPLGG